MITYLHLYQKLTFIRMSTPQCHEINVMTFDAECHEICIVGRKTNVMTLMSWDLENVMRFIFSGTGPWADDRYSLWNQVIHVYSDEGVSIPSISLAVRQWRTIWHSNCADIKQGMLYENPEHLLTSIGHWGQLIPSAELAARQPQFVLPYVLLMIQIW